MSSQLANLEYERINSIENFPPIDLTKALHGEEEIEII